MRKRLRKKCRLAEFRENAFDVSYMLRADLSPNDAEEFLMRFLESAIEANNLACGGGGQGATWVFCVTLAGRGSPTGAQRAAVGTWLAGQPGVVHHSLGDSVDAWHPLAEAAAVQEAAP